MDHCAARDCDATVIDCRRERRADRSRCRIATTTYRSACLNDDLSVLRASEGWPPSVTISQNQY